MERFLKNYFTQDDEKLKWKTGEEKLLLNTCVFDIVSSHNVNEAGGGVEGDYITVNAKDWVVVIPEFNDSFLLVKQWRHGEKALSIEFPGGVIDPGEEPEQAALRELTEETGFVPGKIVKIGEANPNPALFSNKVHFYLAQDLKKEKNQDLDDDEFINCIEVAKNDVLDLIGTMQFPHALMGTALASYIKFKGIKLV